MTAKSANTIVLGTGGILVTYTLLRGARRPTRGSTYKALWAIGLLTLGLGVAADFAPEIVGPFALLVTLAAVVRNPGEIGRHTGRGQAPAETSADTSIEPGLESPGMTR